MKRDGLAVKQGVVLSDDVLGDEGEIELSSFQVHLARLNLGEIENVIDQAKQVLSVPFDGRQRIHVAFTDFPSQFADQAFGEPDNRVHGRSQFMRHVRQELALDLARSPGVANRLV